MCLHYLGTMYDESIAQHVAAQMHPFRINTPSSSCLSGIGVRYATDSFDGHEQDICEMLIVKSIYAFGNKRNNICCRKSVNGIMILGIYACSRESSNKFVALNFCKCWELWEVPESWYHAIIYCMLCKILLLPKCFHSSTESISFSLLLFFFFHFQFIDIFLYFLKFGSFGE